MFSLVVVVASLLAIKNVSAECFDNDGGPQVCIPGHWDIAKLQNAKISSTSTCGNPPERYCQIKPQNGCFMCNSSNSVENIVDVNNETANIVSAETWWQSETWWKWYQTHPIESLQVNITLSFNKSFDMTGLLTLTFKSPRPLRMVLEKSSDHGRSWKILQFYASDCEQQFPGITITDPLEMRLNDTKAYCTEKYSSISPQSGGKIFFDFKTRYDEEADFFDQTIQKYLHTTDLRIRLLYPGTNGLENGGKTEDILNQFYYAVSDLSIIGRCKCYGHAKFCVGYKTTTKCECLHNTDGPDCERCLPLYNNRTWQPATSKLEANPCERCECYEHADSCIFNQGLGFGVCQDCKHNTAGYFCQECQEKFYRNTSLPINHTLTCPACDCDIRGVTNNGTCNQTTGQCECRQNITGRQCDRCVDTYYGYINEPQGQCTACECVKEGTVNGSLNCHQVSGNCNCKRSIDQRTCSRCKDGYYDFPTNITDDCKKCDCDYGGSASRLCNKINGTCECRKNIQGTRCTTVPTGYYTGSPTHFKIEAEQSDGIYQYSANTEDLNKYFTGTGYAMITGQQFVVFNFKSNYTFKGNAVLRYTSVVDGIPDLQMKVVGKRSDGCRAFTDTYLIRGLQKGNGMAWKSSRLIDICKGQEYTFNVSFTTAVNSSVNLDSLILIPLITETIIYKIASEEGNAHGIEAKTIQSCWDNATTLIAANESLTVCENVTFSAMSEVLDGALSCQCNSFGSIPNSVCSKQGGQCQCKLGVTGQSCDRCMPGYYNFSPQGCTACNCNSLGSHHLVCNAFTGECPCRPGVITRTCSQCNHTYYGFNTGRGCVECKCNASGSADMQCDGDTGKCPCKNSTRGDKCDECNHGYFNYTSTGCQACNCDHAGSSTLQCNLETGKCDCKKNVLGFKCDQCRNGTYNRDVNNPHGCTPCFCFGRSGNCSSAKGFVKGFTSYDGQQGDGWFLEKINIELQQGERVSELIARFQPSSRLTLTLSKTLKRYQLWSYGELITFNMTYKAESRSINANWTVVIEDRISRRVSFPLQPSPSANISIYHARIHEAYATIEISARRLQEIMADVVSIKLAGDFHSNGSVTVSEARLYTAVPGTDEEPAGNVENCTCNEEKFTGLSCELCGEGYTRDSALNIAQTTSRYSDGCELCSCSNRSKECDPENGTCLNCRTGTEGDRCQSCEPNVNTSSDCTECEQNFYGLYLPWKPRGCIPCNCLLKNTLYENQTVCQTGLNASTDTGQCVCKADIAGRRCDRCHENAYNNSQGHCIDCPECYRLLQVFVHDLRENITKLEGAMSEVRNGRIGDQTFAKRLNTSRGQVQELVLRAQNSTGVEKQLHDELENLNQTLDHMEVVLKGDVSSRMTSVEGVATEVAKERNTTEELMNLTQTLVEQAYILLNRSISVMISQGNETEEYLAELVPRFGAYANDSSTTSARQNQTAREILQKTLAAEDLVRNADNISNATVSALQVNTEMIRRLKLEVEAVKELGVKANDSAYGVFANATAVLSNAQRALSRVNELNPDSSRELQQIMNNASVLSENATQAVQTVQELNQRYSTLISNVEQAVKDTQVLVSSVTTLDKGATTMLTEAQRAEKEAQTAVDSAKRIHDEMQDMLTILRAFEDKANESQLLAQRALEQSKEANETSRRAIEYSQNISTSIQAALNIANDGLEMARRAQELATDENKNVSDVHSQAADLQRKADESTHTPEMFASKNTSASNIHQSIQKPIQSCLTNYSTGASFAKRESEKALNTSQEASQAINNAKNGVDQILSEIPHLPQVNATRLAELREKIRILRADFTQKNVEALNRQLKIEQDRQQQFIDDYKKQIRELRTQVEEMKLLRNSLSSTPHRGCT